MGLTDFVKNALLLRKLLASQERQEAYLESIAKSLTRLADHVAPIHPVPDAATLTTTGISFSRDSEQVAIQDFSEKMLGDVGRLPTDDELLEYLNSTDPRFVK